MLCSKTYEKKRKGKERKGKERKGKERNGRERGERVGENWGIGYVALNGPKKGRETGKESIR